MSELSSRPTILVISDSIGETAELVSRAAAIQFSDYNVEIRRFPYVNDKDHIVEIIDIAKEHSCMIVYTLVDKDLADFLEKEAGDEGVPIVDLLGPLMRGITNLTGAQPKLQPGLLYKMDQDYFKRIEAVEFAIKYDDGKDPRGMAKADLVLIGVSRTSKTPLSMYLAHRKLKVANYPIVPEVTPPKELFEIPPNKIVGLTINPDKLNVIRDSRLKTMGLNKGSNYASLERILSELEYAQQLMRKLRCPVVNVSQKAIEETANEVLKIMKERN